MKSGRVKRNFERSIRVIGSSFYPSCHDSSFAVSWAHLTDTTTPILKLEFLTPLGFELSCLQSSSNFLFSRAFIS